MFYFTCDRSLTHGGTARRGKGTAAVDRAASGMSPPLTARKQRHASSTRRKAPKGSVIILADATISADLPTHAPLPCSAPP